MHADDFSHSLADPICHRLTVLDAEAVGNLILVNIHAGLPVFSKMHHRVLVRSVSPGFDQIVPRVVSNPCILQNRQYR